MQIVRHGLLNTYCALNALLYVYFECEKCQVWAFSVWEIMITKELREVSNVTDTYDK